MCVKYVYFSALWGVVNNAGIARPRGFLEFTRREDYEKTAAVNLFGAIDVTLTFLPLLKNGGGRLAQITSVAGRNAITSMAGGYNEAKHGLEAFSDNVRYVLAPIPAWLYQYCTVTVTQREINSKLSYLLYIKPITSI